MSRQWNGKYIHPDAEIFLEENGAKVPDLKCPNCNHTISEQYNIIFSVHHDSFYDDGPDLRTIKLKDGRIAVEIIETEPWSSGPYSFIVIDVYKDNKEVKPERIGHWTEEEIEQFI